MLLANRISELVLKLIQSRISSPTHMGIDFYAESHGDTHITNVNTNAYGSFKRAVISFMTQVQEFVQVLTLLHFF